MVKLNLDEEEKLPPFEIIRDGKEYSYDALVLSFRFHDYKETKNPVETAEKLSDILAIEGLAPFESMLILQKFGEFMKEQEEILKKVFGRLPFSTITTESPQSNTENSEVASSSDSSVT